ncbi:MAG TPA: DsrE family protein [Longimicrobiaceae bacterium]|nr:DsrE family protein [Longimicrobiaceae bacterium]
MKKARLVLLAAAALGLPGALHAQQPQFPVIQGHGGAIAIPDAAVQPRKDLEYKVVFDVTGGAPKPDEANPGLEHIARFLNVYALAGIPPQKLKLVAVLSGPATPAVLDDAHYRARFDVANPNLDLIDQLTKAGVKLYVCGQALAGMHLDPAWVDPDVTRALSALTVVPTYQMEGYALEKF